MGRLSVSRIGRLSVAVSRELEGGFCAVLRKPVAYILSASRLVYRTDPELV